MTKNKMGGEKEIGTTKTDTSCLAGTTGAAKLLAAGGSAIVFPKAPQFNIESSCFFTVFTKINCENSIVKID